ncbi:MAG: xylulokinase [Clostridia bacterium]|nr:xylulokinase [Clostridia bacterium]
MAFLIGIDIGTSGTKTVLFDLEGNTVASALREYPLYQPQQGWAEQEPEDWWRAVCATLLEVTGKVGVCAQEIKGIGLSGQMHGLVMLGAQGEVLRRSIIWCDQRTAQECVEITEKTGARRLIEITANPALTGFTASKILWVRNHEPQVYEQCRHILLPKDYIRYRLTGEFATEVSDASGMQLLDIRRRDWSDELLQTLGIDKSLLAPVHESIEITACVSREAASLTGLREGTPVAGGAGDQAAGAVGNGIVREGVLSSTIGTSGVVFAHTDSPCIDPQGRIHTFCHAVPGAWHIMGVTQAAGLSLKWFRDNFCSNEKETAALLGIDPYVLLDKEAGLVPAGASGIFYLPYLMGERTPHLDPDARGVFFGLSAIHTRRDMLRAVMEGVAYSLRDCMELIRQTGVTAGEVRASGGGGRSALWRQMQADMFGCPVCTVNSSEGGALGVALLAGVGAGVWADVRQACDAVIRTGAAQEPDAGAAGIYSARYETYRALYGALKDLF